MVTEKQYFTLTSEKKSDLIVADEVILRNIKSPCYTYIGNYFYNLAEQLLGTYKKSMKYNLDGNRTILTLPNKYSIVLTPLTTNGILIMAHSTRGKVVFETTIHLYKKLNILGTITNTVSILIEELCKL